MSAFEDILAQALEQGAVPTVDEAARKMEAPSHVRETTTAGRPHGHEGSTLHESSNDDGAEEGEPRSERNSDVGQPSSVAGRSQEDPADPVPVAQDSTPGSRGSLPADPVRKRTEAVSATEIRKVLRSDTSELAFAPGVAFAHGTEETAVKRFPKTLVEHLRSLLAAHAGHPFAKECSVAQLLTAFVLAQTGTELEALDVNTAKAVTAFQAMDPRLGAIEDGVWGIDQQVHRVATGVTDLAKGLEGMQRTNDALELALAFLLTDRFVALKTNGMTERTAVIDDPKALEMRETLRRQAAAQRKLRQQRDGRPI
jgi:hypothetical protein